MCMFCSWSREERILLSFQVVSVAAASPGAFADETSAIVLDVLFRTTRGDKSQWDKLDLRLDHLKADDRGS